MKLYFNKDKLENLLKEIRTVPVDGEGHVLDVGYTDEFVRNTIIKLIADNNALHEQNEKQVEWMATVINSYHHVMTYGLTQEGICLLPQAIKATESA